MSQWFVFPSIFAKKNQHPAYSRVADQIIVYLFSCVQEKSLVAELASRHEATTHQDTAKALPQLLVLYTALERFISEQTPPVVHAQLTVEEIRQNIRNHFPIAELPTDFRLIFLTESERALYLGSRASNELIAFLASSLGITSVQTIFHQVSGGTFLKDTTITESGLIITNVLERAQATPYKEVIGAFKVLNASLFQEIINVLGEKSALELIQRIYSTIKEEYDPSNIAIFLDVLPLGVLESERATFLSKEELGRKIEERTAELLTAQQELKLERDRAKAIISSIGEGLITLDASSAIISINHAAEHLLGAPAEQLLSQPWRNHITVLKNEREDISNSFLEHAMQQGEMVNVGLHDNVSFKVQSRIFPVAAIITPLQRQGVMGAVIIFRDITSEKQANEIIERTVVERTKEVQEGRARLLASINSLKLGFIMTDRDLTVTIVNEAAATILPELHGKVAGEYTLEDVSQLFGDAVDLLASARSVTTTQKAIDFDSILQGSRYLHIYLSPITHREEPIGCAILIEDVTEARVLARSKDEFFTIASHELRTPLIAIRGYASMIQESFPTKISNDDVLRMVDRIDASGNRLINIVNSFLDMSRLEQGQMDFHYKEFDMNEVVQTCIEELNPLANEKNISLHYSPQEPSTVSADKNLTKQVLYNLVGNGIKFTNQGEVTITVSSNTDALKVSVTDTGTGIRTDAQALLFRKFQQTGDSLFTRDNSQGTGLGLYISKLIIEGMHGTIGLESSSEHGSIFYFTLPIRPVPQS